LVTVDSQVELVDSWGNFESFHENSLLSLVKNIFGPADEAGQISLMLHISSNSKVSRLGFEQRVFDLLHGFLLSLLVGFLNLTN
jgi:hypothetical protein